MPRDPHKLYGISLDLNGALGFDVTYDTLPNFKFTAFFNKAPMRYSIRRSDLAIYISCATESERLMDLFCISVV